MIKPHIKNISLFIAILLICTSIAVPSILLINRGETSALDDLLKNGNVLTPTAEELINQTWTAYYGNATIIEMITPADDRIIHWQSDQYEGLAWWCGDRYINLTVIERQ